MRGLRSEVRPCDATFVRAALVSDAAADRVQTTCAQLARLSARLSIVVHRRRSSPSGRRQRTNHESRWRLRSTLTSTLTDVPATCLSTVGDRAVHVAASGLQQFTS